MKNIWNIIGENKKEAIELLRTNLGFNSILDFSQNHTEEEIENGDCFPFVLITNRHNEIGDYAVGKIRLVYYKDIEIYINELEEWVNINECLSATENNVYLAIEEFFNK